MPIDINHLLNMVKQSSQPGMDAGSQAMALAAQQAKPEGGTPLPKAIKPEEDKSGEEEGKMMETMNKLEEKHRKEVEKKDNELQSLKHQLDMEQLDRKRMVGEHSMEQKQKAQMDQLKQQRDELDRYKAEIDRQAMEREKEFERKSMEAQKSMEQEHTNQQTMQQAEQISHQAELDKQTAEQRVAVAEEKAKAVMEISQQQANDYIKTTERAKQTTDKYFADREAAMKANSPVISTALQNQMDSAFKAVGRLGSVRNKINAIPQPGTPPQIKMASIEFYDDSEVVQEQDTLVPASAEVDMFIPMPSAPPMFKRATVTAGVQPESTGKPASTEQPDAVKQPNTGIRSGLSREYSDAQWKRVRDAQNRMADAYIADNYGGTANTAADKAVQAADMEGQAYMSDQAKQSYDSDMRRLASDRLGSQAATQARIGKTSTNEADRVDAFKYDQFNRKVWSSDLVNGNFGGKDESARDAIVNQYRDQAKSLSENEDWNNKSWVGKGLHYAENIATSPWNATKWVAKNVVGSVADDIVNGAKGLYDIAKTHDDLERGGYNISHRYASEANDAAGRSVGGSLLQLGMGVGGALLSLAPGGAAARGLLAAGRAGLRGAQIARAGGAGLLRSGYQGARMGAAKATRGVWRSVTHPFASMKNAPRGWWNNKKLQAAGWGLTGSGLVGGMAGMYGDNANKASMAYTNNYMNNMNNGGYKPYGDPNLDTNNTYGYMYSTPGGTSNGYQYGQQYNYNNMAKTASIPGADPREHDAIVSDVGDMTDYNTGYDHQLIGNANWGDSLYYNTTAGKVARMANPFLKMFTGIDLMKRDGIMEQGMWKQTPLSPQERLIGAMDVTSDNRLMQNGGGSNINRIIDSHTRTYGPTPYFNRITSPGIPGFGY